MEFSIKFDTTKSGWSVVHIEGLQVIIFKKQGCGNTMPCLSDLVPFYSGQVENLNLLVLGQVRNLL